MKFQIKITQALLPVYLLFILLTFFSPPSQAISIVIDNLDPVNQGFNDSTAVPPIGGNSGITIGQQRLNAINYAAGLVEALLPASSTQTITIGSKFINLGDCTTDATGLFLLVILGGASPNTVHKDFAGSGGLSPLSGTWYPGPVANAIADTDLCTSGSICDIAPDPLNPALGIPTHLEAYSVFNTEIDSGLICDILTGGQLGWYYGLDENPPDNFHIDFATIAFHEIMHAVGFLSLIDVTNGQLFMGDSDVYSEYLEDHNSGTSLPNMLNNSQRSSAITSGNLHWTSPNVVNTYGDHMLMYSPNPAEEGSSISHFDFSTGQVMEPGYVAGNHNAGLAQQLIGDLYVQVGCTTGQTGELLAQCSDLLDNDCDGLIDSFDLDCPQPCLITQDPELDCSDGLDNDCNSDIDTADSNCQTICAAGCIADELPAELTCNDGFDNDCDGLVDLNDTDDCPACVPTELPNEVTCTGNVDEDCDGLVDLNDTDCSSFSCIATEMPEVSCLDGIDNDCDGVIDDADTDCVAPSCSLLQLGDSCLSDTDCCSNKCKGGPSNKTCK